MPIQSKNVDQDFISKSRLYTSNSNEIRSFVYTWLLQIKQMFFKVDSFGKTPDDGSNNDLTARLFVSQILLRAVIRNWTIWISTPFTWHICWLQLSHCCTHLHHDGDSYRVSLFRYIVLRCNPFRLVTNISFNVILCLNDLSNPIEFFESVCWE